MELSPSWEAANCAVTQEFPNILWGPEVLLQEPSASKEGYGWKGTVLPMMMTMIS
jgi:hypothetical protein